MSQTYQESHDGEQTPGRTSTETLVKALHILADEIETTDGVANAALREAAERLGWTAAINRRLCETLRDVLPSAVAYEMDYYPDNSDGRIDRAYAILHIAEKMP